MLNRAGEKKTGGAPGTQLCQKLSVPNPLSGKRRGYFLPFTRSGRIPHAEEQLRPCTTTTEPVLWVREPHLLSRHSRAGDPKLSLCSRAWEPQLLNLRSRAQEPRLLSLRSRAREPRLLGLRSRAPEPRLLPTGKNPRFHCRGHVFHC